MDYIATDPPVPDSRYDIIMLNGVEVTVATFLEKYCQPGGEAVQFIKENRLSTNTLLFSFLALLNSYVPDSYLLMSECQRVLRPRDPIHGGPPFEERMEPFTVFIDTSSQDPDHVCMKHKVLAQEALKLLADSGISRSDTAKMLMYKLCGDQPQQHTVEFIKYLLTKREMTENGTEKFSRLIEDIVVHEDFYKASVVLKTASSKFRQNSIFPQTVSRLYYIKRGTGYYQRAEEWAVKAIARAKNSSYVADTLGQVKKNRLLREAKEPDDIFNRAEDAFEAFKDVEMKADKEEGPEMNDAVSNSISFNNRGRFGFIQVAKIAFEKLNKKWTHRPQKQNFFQSLIKEVEDKFDFFEWYLTYSKPEGTALEPPYFWRDVAGCYELYTGKTAADSTSFPGLLDRLNHGLFTSKGRRARFEEAEITASDLEAIRDDLKTTYKANVRDVKAAERFILSNIILSDKTPNSPQLTPLRDLRTILQSFLNAEKTRRSPEFYLVALLLFWPDEEADNHDLQQQVTYMAQAFERATYAKYLRGRCLLPLFFLGKGTGLSKWIHRSRLDAIVERKVDAELADENDKCMKKKWRRINKMWTSGGVWQVPEVQNILLPVQVEPCQPATTSSERDKEEVFVCVGGKKIIATLIVGAEAEVQSPVLHYLGFTIQGPVVFKSGPETRGSDEWGLV